MFVVVWLLVFFVFLFSSSSLLQILFIGLFNFVRIFLFFILLLPLFLSYVYPFWLLFIHVFLVHLFFFCILIRIDLVLVVAVMVLVVVLVVVLIVILVVVVVVVVVLLLLLLLAIARLGVVDNSSLYLQYNLLKQHHILQSRSSKNRRRAIRLTSVPIFSSSEPDQVSIDCFTLQPEFVYSTMWKKNSATAHFDTTKHDDNGAHHCQSPLTGPCNTMSLPSMATATGCWATACIMAFSSSARTGLDTTDDTVALSNTFRAEVKNSDIYTVDTKLSDRYPAMLYPWCTILYHTNVMSSDHNILMWPYATLYIFSKIMSHHMKPKQIVYMYVISNWICVYICVSVYMYVYIYSIY